MCEFIVYKKNQGGYYVSYKDKLSDNFSENWWDAKRYKSINFAIKRLGLYFTKNQTSFEYFIKSNKLDKSYERDKKISKLLNEDKSNSFIFENGFIDVILTFTKYTILFFYTLFQKVKKIVKIYKNIILIYIKIFPYKCKLFIYI